MKTTGLTFDEARKSGYRFMRPTYWDWCVPGYDRRFHVSDIDATDWMIDVPPKKKATKTIEAWVNVYRSGGIEVFRSEEYAIGDSYSKAYVAVAVRMIGTYEVECDE